MNEYYITLDCASGLFELTTQAGTVVSRHATWSEAAMEQARLEELDG